MDAETLERVLALLNAEPEDGPASNPYAALVRAARAEALAEAGARLKEMFVQAILQTALGLPPAAPTIATPPAPPAASAGPALPPATAAASAPSAAVGGSPPAGGAASRATAAAEALAAPLAECPSPAPAAEATPAAPSAPIGGTASASEAAVETPAVAPGPAAEPDGQGQDDRQRLLDEMAAIRRQIAENEARLHTVQAPPPSTEEAAGVPAPESAARAVATAEADAAAAGAAPTQEGEAYYIYGLLPAGVSLPTEGEAIAGIDPAFPVTALTCREIQAAVSRVPLREFGEEELAARFEDLVWVEEKVRRHQEVLEALMRHGPLVPLRFCTLYHSPERVQTLLSDNHDRWAHILNTLRGKQEWGVKVYFAREALVAQVGEVSPKVQKLRAQIAQRSSGAAYFVKKQLEDAIAEEVERLSDQYAQDSHDRLAGCAVQACLNSLQNADAAEDEVKMLVNGAYLVDEAQWTAFRAELSALEAQYGPLGLTYTLTGPWPPYNFIPASEEDTDESGCS